VVEKRVLQKDGESAAGIGSGSETGSVDATEGMEVTDAMAFTSEELREFLEADLAGNLADPAFKQRLRDKLWTMLQRRGGGPSRDEH
jgi:hypothetical protein